MQSIAGIAGSSAQRAYQPHTHTCLVSLADDVAALAVAQDHPGQAGVKQHLRAAGGADAGNKMRRGLSTGGAWGAEEKARQHGSADA